MTPSVMNPNQKNKEFADTKFHSEFESVKTDYCSGLYSSSFNQVAINTGSFQMYWQLDKPRQCALPIQRGNTKWHIHSKGTGEMWNYQYHLPMVFATLAFKIMNSCRQIHWREHHFTTLHSCSTLAAEIFLNRPIWQRYCNRKGRFATLQEFRAIMLESN